MNLPLDQMSSYGLQGRRGALYNGLLNEAAVSNSGDRNSAFMKGKTGLPVRTQALT